MTNWETLEFLEERIKEENRVCEEDAEEVLKMCRAYRYLLHGCEVSFDKFKLMRTCEVFKNTDAFKEELKMLHMLIVRFSKDCEAAT